jgi:hypothetical protein
MMNSAKQYHAYARECLNLAEEAEQPDVRKSLIELKAVRGLRCRRHRFERRDVFGLGYLVPNHQWSRSCRIA